MTLRFSGINITISMANLQQILTSLGNDQKLGPGYLTPAGTPVPTAAQTCIALKQQFDMFTRIQFPLPNMTDVPTPNVLLSPAYVHNGAGLPPGIYLSDVGGNVDSSHAPQPAYVFVS